MSAYFESLNRRVSRPPVASVPAVAPEPAVMRPAPIRPAARRLVPGAVPSAYSMLRERLMVAAQGKSLKSIVFAGCDGGEGRSEEHTSELQSLRHLVCRLLLE